MRGTELSDLIGRGCRLALGDGAGMPVQVLPELCRRARAAGDVRLLLGWCVGSLDGFDPTAFADVRTIMGGYGLRTFLDEGSVRYVPARMHTVLKLLRGALRPDVLVASIARGKLGWHFTTEVAWQRAAVDAGAIVAGIVRPERSTCDGGPPIPEERLRIIGEDASAPLIVAWPEAGAVHRAIADRVTPLIHEGSRVQVGPGPQGSAILDALHVPVRIDTGIITDAVPRLQGRGLMIGDAIAPYLVGSAALYDWASGRKIVFGVEFTHDQARLQTGAPFVSILTALEVDLDGQINVEAVGGSTVAGIGGQPDYAFAAASVLQGGLSILAVPTRNGRHSTLVDRLSAPVSTPAHDVDVLVTENGVSDLRGLDRKERRRAIAALWPADPASA